MGMHKHEKPLTKRDLHKLEANTLGWKLNTAKTKLVKTFPFKGHVDALIFIARLTVHAEILKHHPDIHFTYAKVKITLHTHDVKALTKKDLALLSRIEKLHAKLQIGDNIEGTQG